MAHFAGFSIFEQDKIVPCQELPAWPLGLAVLGLMAVLAIYYSFGVELLVRIWRPSITFILR